MDHLPIAPQIAKFILDSFDHYVSEFHRITQKAREKFEKKDWDGRHLDAIARFDLYEKILHDTHTSIKQNFRSDLEDESLWIDIKYEFSELIAHRSDTEIAETFYNSVTRKIFQTIGLNREIEFFNVERVRHTTQPTLPGYRTYPARQNTKEIVRRILSDIQFSIPYENLERDARYIANEVDLRMWPLAGFENKFSIEVIPSPFYRNRAAYIIGRIRVREQTLPFVLPMYNGDSGIYVDTVLLNEPEVSTVFSFAFSYFHVEFERTDLLVHFLKSIIPGKPISELYISLGFNRHGKTEFYRDLHKLIHDSKEKFIIAPGKEGAIMIVFTLPVYNYVFKVIKDGACFLRSDMIPPKVISRDEVKHKYNFVCHRDRVGRMVDTQEFENLRFKRARFSKDLLREFELAAHQSVTIEEEYVIIHHLYVQRRVNPFPLYLNEEKDPEILRDVIIDFGHFLKDMAAAGIFPSDLFNIWNYGITQRKRVVLYDYDDIIPLEEAKFRKKPIPKSMEEEIGSEEDWVSASADDFFVEEMDMYSGIPSQLKGIFKSIHADLYTVEFWNDMKERVKQGEIVNIFPYDLSKQFRNRYQKNS